MLVLLLGAALLVDATGSTMLDPVFEQIGVFVLAFTSVFFEAVAAITQLVTHVLQV